MNLKDKTTCLVIKKNVKILYKSQKGLVLHLLDFLKLWYLIVILFLFIFATEIPDLKASRIEINLEYKYFTKGEKSIYIFSFSR